MQSMAKWKNAELLKYAFGVIIMMALLVTNSASAKNNPTLKLLGKAYQQNYTGQKRLPDNASPAQREAVTRRAFAEANRALQKDVTRKHRELAAAESKTLRGLAKVVKANQAAKKRNGLSTPGVKGKEAAAKKKKKIAELLAKGKAKGKGGKDKKVAGKGGAKGAPGDAKGGAASSSAPKSATEVTGAEGAKDVNFGKEKELKIIDGIIQED